MSQELLFFALRLAAAALLLTFLGLIFWYLYRDVRNARLGAMGPTGGHGSLRILSNPTANPPVDSVIDLSLVSTIGRNKRNTIVLDDAYVSGEHALITWRDSQWWLEDLGSRNGTRLNEVALTDPVVISAGDIITIGDIQFKFELPGHKEEEESGIRDSNP